LNLPLVHIDFMALQSVAARSDIEMGYTKEQVLDSLRKINELRPGMSFSCFH
jgi:hypothetical protein